VDDGDGSGGHLVFLGFFGISTQSPLWNDLLSIMCGLGGGQS
jgi:hypothetical protein